MANNILSAQINVTAPNVAATANSVSKATDKMAASLKKVAPASNQATGSLVNLGRVIQDAPFGFIGVANNLNPLFEGFGRLRKETGSAGAAFKSLGKELLGAGGISIAISLVSSALILFGDKLFGAGKKAQEAADASEKLKKSIEGIFSAAAKEASQVNGFVGVLKSETETRERKLAAIKELQNIQPEVFKNLKLEGNLVTGLDVAYQQYLANLKTVIAVKIKQAQLEQLLEKQLKSQGVTLTENEKAFQRGIDQLKERRKLQSEAAGAKNPFEQEAKDAKVLQKDIDALVKDIIELSKGVKVDQLKITPDNVDLGEIRKALEKPVALPFTINAKELEFVLLGGDIQTFKEQVDEKITKEIERLVVAPRFNFSPEFLKVRDAQLAAQRVAESIGKAFNDGIKNIAADGIGNIAEAIGTALGGGDIANAFRQFAQSLGSAIEALGKQIIAIGVAALLAKDALKALFTNPAIAIAAGAALVAAGAALKAALGGGIKGFRAAGGPVGAGQSFVVGERGPEVFTPNTGGRITSNSSLAMSNGGAGGEYIFRIGGYDLVAVLNRNQSRQRRLQ